MKQIKQESGRSMVEMLGVLAVIGVLSVGGISGYTLAMNKHRANSVAADLMKRAVVVSAQRQLGQTASLNGFNNQVGDYTTDNQVGTATEGKFSMTVQAVPEEVCKKILALDWDNATISPDTAEGCDGGDMTFTYNNDLSPVTGSGSTGGEGTDTPQEPTCTGTVVQVYNCDTKETTACCPDNGNNCTQPVCSCDAETECPGTQVCQNDQCGCPEASIEWTNGTNDSRTVIGELGSDGQTCCYDGFEYSGTSYSVLNPAVCGCPSNETADALGENVYQTKNNVCCTSNGGKLSQSSELGYLGYYEVDISECGCPKGDVADMWGADQDVVYQKGNVCCSEYNLAYQRIQSSQHVYTKVDIPNCGCPVGGIVEWGELWNEVGENISDPNLVSLQNGTCCSRYGLALSELGEESSMMYSQVDITNCGCPLADMYSGEKFENVEFKNGVCCSNGKEYTTYYNEDYGRTGGKYSTDSDKCK